MSSSRVVFGFGIAIAVLLWFMGLNNIFIDQNGFERVVIHEDMIVEKDDKLLLVLPELSDVELEMPTFLLDEVVYGNPYAVSYSYNKMSKKGQVVRMKVT